MNNIIQQSIRTKMQRIDYLLQQESQRSHFTGVEAIETRCAAVDTIRSLMSELASFSNSRADIGSQIAPQLEAFAARLAGLPFVPRIEALTWAQNLCQLKPRILVINNDFDEHLDETFLQQIAVVDWDNKPIFQQWFGSDRSSLSAKCSPGDLLARKAGATSALPVEQVWNDLVEAVSGYVIVTYCLPLAQIQLEVTARELHLKAPMLIGQSLLDLCLRYLGYGCEKLLLGPSPEEPMLPFSPALYQRLGDPFSDMNTLDAVQRAQDIVLVLQEMAQGILSIR